MHNDRTPRDDRAVVEKGLKRKGFRVRGVLSILPNLLLVVVSKTRYGTPRPHES